MHISDLPQQLFDYMQLLVGVNLSVSHNEPSINGCFVCSLYSLVWPYFRETNSPGEQQELWPGEEGGPNRRFAAGTNLYTSSLPLAPRFFSFLFMSCSLIRFSTHVDSLHGCWNIIILFALLISCFSVRSIPGKLWSQKTNRWTAEDAGAIQGTLK